MPKDKLHMAKIVFIIHVTGPKSSPDISSYHYNYRRLTLPDVPVDLSHRNRLFATDNIDRGNVKLRKGVDLVHRWPDIPPTGT